MFPQTKTILPPEKEHLAEVVAQLNHCYASVMHTSIALGSHCQMLSGNGNTGTGPTIESVVSNELDTCCASGPACSVPLCARKKYN